MLPFLNAEFTTRPANEDHNKLSDIFSEASVSSKSPQTSCEVILSNMPSDATTKYLSLLFKDTQSDTSGIALTPYLAIEKKSNKYDKEITK